MLTETQLDVLKGAREFLSDPNRWIKRMPYRYDENTQLNGACLMGAVAFKAGFLETPGGSTSAQVNANMLAVNSAIARAIGHSEIIVFNDGARTTHDDVMAVLDRAVAAEELARVMSEVAEVLAAVPEPADPDEPEGDEDDEPQPVEAVVWQGELVYA